MSVKKYKYFRTVSFFMLLVFMLTHFSLYAVDIPGLPDTVLDNKNESIDIRKENKINTISVPDDAMTQYIDPND